MKIADAMGLPYEPLDAKRLEQIKRLTLMLQQEAVHHGGDLVLDKQQARLNTATGELEFQKATLELPELDLQATISTDEVSFASRIRRTSIRASHVREDFQQLLSVIETDKAHSLRDLKSEFMEKIEKECHDHGAVVLGEKFLDLHVLQDTIVQWQAGRLWLVSSVYSLSDKGKASFVDVITDAYHEALKDSASLLNSLKTTKLR